MKSDWQGKRVVILGAARQGTALARCLAAWGAQVVISDTRPAEQLGAEMGAFAADGALANVEWVCGGHPLEMLDGADALCPSGGVPLTLPVVQEALRRGIRLTNDSQIFLENTPCRVIGITGSAGKTTTTTLVARMAALAVHPPQRAWVGGNIGNPLVSSLDEMKAGDLVVMELSSFQLEIMRRSPQIAAILNITPNHLDRHGTMEAYTAAKAHILTHQPQGAGSAVILGCEDPGAWNLRGLAANKLWTFGHRPVEGCACTFVRGGSLWLRDGEEVEIMPQTAIHLRGDHNLLNVLAACAIAGAAGIPPAAMRHAVESFYGVAHRLEFLRKWGGAAWYNDSIATAPERAMAAIRSFDEPIVLLAGGRDKNLPWEDLARLVHERVDHLILFGEARPLIERAIGPTPAGMRPYTCSSHPGLQAAVQAAARIVSEGDVVLLSPGGTSFDEFRDFEARGEAYRKWVMAL